MTWAAIWWALALTFGLFASYTFIGLDNHRYTRVQTPGMRGWAVIWAVLAIWSLCFAISMS